jgi:hypothetical protein
MVHAVGSAGTPIEIDWWLYIFATRSDGTSMVANDGWSYSQTTWSGGGRSALWLDGKVFADGDGNALGFDFRLGQDSSYWRATPGELQSISSNPYDIRIDTASGTGTIRVSGNLIANVSMRGGCVSVDFIDPQKEDRTNCLW